MEHIFTRRSVVKATGATTAIVAAGASLAATAQAGMDAELLALRPLWRQAWAAYDATFEPLAEAEARFNAQSRPMPSFTDFVSGAEYQKAAEAVSASNARLSIEAGVDVAERRQDEACRAEHELADLVFALPARTVEGIRFKLELIEARRGYEEPEMESSLKSDLLRMVGVHDA